MPDSALPPNLRGKKHWDWPTFFKVRWRGRSIPIGLQWVPRGWTAFKWGPPKLILGDQVSVKRDKATGEWAPAPIGEPKSWQVSYYPGAPWWAKATGLAFYVAASGGVGKDGKFRHYRLGTRWDDVDDYDTIFAVASRRFTGYDTQDTSTNK